MHDVFGDTASKMVPTIAYDLVKYLNVPLDMTLTKLMFVGRLSLGRKYGMHSFASCNCATETELDFVLVGSCTMH